jgi:sulfur carrier protein
MQVNVNGQLEELMDGLTINGLLSKKKLKLKSVVVELNGKIIETDEYATLVLKNKDSIEILQFVGGG